MANYLLAGAAGFIASRTAELLITDGHTVIGVDNLNDAYDVRMKEYRLNKLMNLEGFTFRQVELADKKAVAALAEFEPFAGIINLAARAGVRASVEDPWVYVDTNVTGTLNLLELAKDTDCKKFVFASTSSIYGENAPIPTPESANSSTPLQPYAASKKGGEAMCAAYHFLYDIDVTIVRYFTVYGPSGRPDMVMFRFAKWLIEGQPLMLNGDGSQTRGFTFVDDIARGTIQALKPVGHEVINLGGHESISINELIGILERMTGKKAEIEYHPFPKADMTANLADVSKAGELLGWEAQVGLEEGIKRMVDWYLENQDWAKDIKTH